LAVFIVSEAAIGYYTYSAFTMYDCGPEGPCGPSKRKEKIDNIIGTIGGIGILTSVPYGLFQFYKLKKKRKIYRLNCNMNQIKISIDF
jgi:hypothetical protein